KTSSSDSGDIDIVLKRSLDGGATWGPLNLVYEEGGNAPITIGNPTVLVDDQGTIQMVFTRNSQQVFWTRSTDDGVTWATPTEISSVLRGGGFAWNQVGSGPGNGIETRGGRLLIPVWLRNDPSNQTTVIYSDDHGQSWHPGGIVPATANTFNEGSLVELVDG